MSEPGLRSLETPEPEVGATRPRDSRPVVAIALGLFVLTIPLRGARLGRPPSFVLDEIFYVHDALDLVTHGAERTFVGHPPLAKWLIGIPFFFGEFNPLTWRAGALVAGAAVVSLVYVCAAHVSRSGWVGLAAAAFVLTDGISHFAGRYALLDGFAALFATAALCALLVTARREIGYRLALGVGALCGAALACKWSTAPIVAVAVVAVAARTWRTQGLSRAASTGAAALGAAILVYLATFTPWIVGGSASGNCIVPACDDGPIARLVRLPAMQRTMLESDAEIPRDSPLRSDGWRWMLQDRPMRVFVAYCEAGTDELCRPGSESTMWIAVRGNRMLWSVALPVFAAWGALRIRHRREPAKLPGVGLAITWALALWLPWMLVPKPFLFYAAPIVPALAVAASAAVSELAPRRLAPYAFALAIAAGAAIFVSTLTGPPWSV